MTRTPEQQALDYTMAYLGLNPGELTPEREMLIRESSVYRWRLLHLQTAELGRQIHAAFTSGWNRVLDVLPRHR